MPPLRFHDWTFSDDLHTAHADSGQEVHFARQERILLAEFTAAPRLLLTRKHLLATLPRKDGSSSERHLDYLINRIRQRLGDTARNPRFIATQYGEGYVWIATPSSPVALNAFLVILPLHRHMPPAADTLAEALRDTLREHLARPNAVDIAPPGWQPDPASQATYLLEISAYADPTTLHLALLLRDARTRQPLHPMRLAHPLARTPGVLALFDDARALAAQIHQLIWQHQALEPGHATPADLPFELRLHEATRLFGEQSATWRDSLAYIEQLEDSQRYRNPASDIIRATALLTRIIQQAPHTGMLDAPQWDALETEIEALVLPHLTAMAGQPLLELAAARLLHYLGGRHADTAFALARRGFAGTTAFATAFATLAQCHSHAGEFAAAHELYDRAIDLAEPGSEFHVYLLVLKCLACLGSGDLAALAHWRAVLFIAKPATRQETGLIFHSPDPELPADLAAVLPLLGDTTLSQLLYLLQRNARSLFRHPEHQANLLRGPVTQIARHVGTHVVPAALHPLLGAAPPPGA